MADLNLITDNWGELLENLKEHSFGDGEFDQELFRVTMKDTFDYFCNVGKSQKNLEECRLSMKECALISRIYAYIQTIICTFGTDVEDYCYASQYVALLLYKEITQYWGFKDIDLSKDIIFYRSYIFEGSGRIVIEYNLETGDMSDVLSKIEYVKTIVHSEYV